MIQYQQWSVSPQKV